MVEEDEVHQDGQGESQVFEVHLLETEAQEVAEAEEPATPDEPGWESEDEGGGNLNCWVGGGVPCPSKRK